MSDKLRNLLPFIRQYEVLSEYVRSLFFRSAVSEVIDFSLKLFEEPSQVHTVSSVEVSESRVLSRLTHPNSSLVIFQEFAFDIFMEHVLQQIK